MLANIWTGLTDEQIGIIEKHQEKLPVKVGQIANDFGLKVKSSTLDPGISGEIRIIDEQPIIKINRHDVKARQRFTLAHEIAHFLLHKDKIGNGIVDDILYRSGLSDILEAEANRLAADILMPWKPIKDWLKNNSGMRLEEQIENLSEELGVSITAVKIRLGKA